jgi:hypothetical protein
MKTYYCEKCHTSWPSAWGDKCPSCDRAIKDELTELIDEKVNFLFTCDFEIPDVEWHKDLTPVEWHKDLTPVPSASSAVNDLLLEYVDRGPLVKEPNPKRWRGGSDE